MDKRYEQFSMADPLFYESPSRSRLAQRRFAAGREVPTGWERHEKEVWTILAPPRPLPPQGWKIHVSTTIDNAEDVLNTVWEYCVPRRLSFKFLNDLGCLLIRNAKYADRSGSGKFVTIYPADLAELESTLRELGALLEGRQGPYILSDVRWGAGPLHVRYGGFAERWSRNADGRLVLAIAEPSGRLVPDQRRPSFQLPAWVDVPDFLAACVKDRLAPDTRQDFPFSIEQALHYSNGGGIYLATDNRSGRRVVLKEARPFAGLDSAGHDAVHRLGREREFLEKLAGTGVAPDLHGHFTCWEHEFLVEEYVEGTTLGQALVQRCPLTHSTVGDQDVRDYARWAVDVLDRVRAALRVLHSLGIVFGDLHPHNILVRPDGEVRFIDFELASHLTDRASPALGAPGYAPADARGGEDVDHYAMACLTLSLFLPLTMLLPLYPAKARMLVDSIRRIYPLPEGFLTEAAELLCTRRPAPAPVAVGDDSLVAALASGMDTGRPDWPRLRASIRDAILASATPQRADRLFPGDIEQFSLGGTGLAHGAAGVLYALARSGAGRFPEHEQWLLDAAAPGRYRGGVGFYDGLHGIAYTLAELGRLDDAVAVLERAMDTAMDELSHCLFDGLAGVGLNLLHFAALTGEESLRGKAIEAGARLLAQPPERDPRRTRAGLLYGPSGQALLHIRLFEATGDRRFLDAAEDCLRADSDRCVALPDGSRQLDERWRVMPYLATGSAGVGAVIHEFLRHRDHDSLAATLAGIRLAAHPTFTVCPGLFNGRAGFITFLAWLDSAGSRPVIDRHLRRLAWHLVPYRGQAAFPGDQLLRLSMDLATGSAGVLFALGAALDENGPMLPFFSNSKERR